MIEFRRRHPIIYCAAAVAAGMIGMLLESWLWGAGLASGLLNGIDAACPWLDSVLCKGIPIVLSVALLASTGMLGLLRRRGTGFFHGIACGAFMIVFFALFCLYVVANVIEYGAKIPSSDVLSKVLVYYLLVGIGEEFLARGVSAETLLAHFGLERSGVLKACVLSGVIFGTMHIVNLFQADVTSVLFQIVTTSGIGMLFAAIYFRCGNIWSCIVLHMLWDATFFVATIVPSGADTSAVGGNGSAGSVVFFAMTVAVAAFLLRKKKLPQVKEAWDDMIEAEQ